MEEPLIIKAIGSVFPFIWCGVMLLIIFWAIKGVKVIMAFNKEKSLYAVMINNPTDSTVQNYLTAYQKTTTSFANYINNNRAVEHRNDQLRQSQGYEIISECDSVSDGVKTQLRNDYIAQGVPIKRKASK